LWVYFLSLSSFSIHLHFMCSDLPARSWRAVI
jgi:hypothetical protein